MSEDHRRDHPVDPDQPTIRSPLRPAGPEDAALVLTLIREYYEYDGIVFDAPSIAAGLETLLRTPALGRVFLIESGAVAGYMILTFGFDLELGGRQATVTDVYLRPGFRRTGLGSATFGSLEHFATSVGVLALELQAARANTEARAFYEKLGFAEHDRIPMSKSLHPTS